MQFSSTSGKTNLSYVTEDVKLMGLNTSLFMSISLSFCKCKKPGLMGNVKVNAVKVKVHNHW